MTDTHDDHMSGQSWQTPALAALIEQCYETFDASPESLLERDGHPGNIPADIFVARLYGADQQLDHDWRISRIEPELRAPIRPVMRATLGYEPTAPPLLPVASYSLQNGVVVAGIAGEYVTPLVPWKPTVTVLCLRYQRRL